MVGRRNWLLLLLIGLAAPGAPIRRLLSMDGLTKLPLANGGPGRDMTASAAAAGAFAVPLLLLPLTAGGGTCCPFLANGLDLVWSMPGVLRIEGLSARGLNTWFA
jgi:hypothetical protein